MYLTLADCYKNCPILSDVSIGQDVENANPHPLRLQKDSNKRRERERKETNENKMKCGNRLLSPPVAPVPPSATATALHRPPPDNGKKGTKIKSKMKKANRKVFKSCILVAHGHRDIHLVGR